MHKIVMTAGLLALPFTTSAAEHFFQQLTLPSGQVVTVAEGRGEPASIGSYDLRLYSGANPAFPLDEFSDGKVLSRDGTIKALQLQDLTGDKQPELVVIMESAGSGGYLAADAFIITPQGKLALHRRLNGLPPGQDVVKALKNRQK